MLHYQTFFLNIIQSHSISLLCSGGETIEFPAPETRDGKNRIESSRVDSERQKQLLDRQQFAYLQLFLVMLVWEIKPLFGSVSGFTLMEAGTRELMQQKKRAEISLTRLWWALWFFASLRCWNRAKGKLPTAGSSTWWVFALASALQRVVRKGNYARAQKGKLSRLLGWGDHCQWKLLFVFGANSTAIWLDCRDTAIASGVDDGFATVVVLRSYTLEK